MDFKELYRTVEKNRYYVFSFEDLLSFFPNEKRSSLKETLYRWANKGWIYSLKRGLYEMVYPKDFNIPDMYIANSLYNPSYVSLETALSNYSIIPEVAMAITSITTKPTRRFKNKHGLFIYHTVRPAAFCGYYVQKQGGFDILIAEPEKALIDFLYFRTLRNKNFNLKDERLNKDILSGMKMKKLNRYAKVYNINLKRALYAYL